MRLWNDSEHVVEHNLDKIDAELFKPDINFLPN